MRELKHRGNYRQTNWKSMVTIQRFGFWVRFAQKSYKSIQKLTKTINDLYDLVRFVRFLAVGDFLFAGWLLYNKPVISRFARGGCVVNWIVTKTFIKWFGSRDVQTSAPQSIYIYNDWFLLPACELLPKLPDSQTPPLDLWSLYLHRDSH